MFTDPPYNVRIDGHDQSGGRSVTWDDDDGIGYGRTLEWTRFQKGQSGKAEEEMR